MKYRQFYIISLVTLMALSAYPIYMGIKVFSQYLQFGAVASEDYPKYIIPYTPLSIAIIVTATLLPVLYKWIKRYLLPALSLFGVTLFLAAEVFFEQIKVIEGYQTLPLESWQYSLCVATPEVLQSIGEPIYAQNNPAYKVHFYLIAIVILLSIIGILCGYARMFKEGLSHKKRPLIIQTLCVSFFLGLCILACFTAFFRNGTLHISPLSAFLTGLFFVVLGVTLGTYVASHLFGKSKFFSLWLPIIIAMLTTITMYIGELLLMDGKLFYFGKGQFFEPIGILPFSMCDIMIVLISGVMTALILKAIHRKVN